MSAIEKISNQLLFNRGFGALKRPQIRVTGSAGVSVATQQDTTVTTANVLANDDLGDTPTTITAFDAASAAGGSVTDNSDGSFTEFGE